MPVTLAQLRAFAAVSEHRSFSVAAEVLGLAQPSVSSAIAAFERDVGGAVLDRRTVAPTMLGAALLPHAQRALGSVAALDRAAHDLAADVGGVVRLGVVPTVRDGLLPWLLTCWGSALPGVRVEAIEGDDDELPTWLESGLIDAAILVDPPVVDSRARELPGDPMCAVLHRSHPLADQDTVSLAELADDDLICGTGGCQNQLRRMHDEAQEPFVIAHRVAGLATILALVLAGRGVSIVPGHGAGLIPQDLVMVPLVPAYRRQLVLSGAPGREWSPVIDALIAATPRGEDASPDSHSAPAAGRTRYPLLRSRAPSQSR